MRVDWRARLTFAAFFIVKIAANHIVTHATTLGDQALNIDSNWTHDGMQSTTQTSRQMISTGSALADFFNFSIEITPHETFNSSLCTIADQNLLRNEVDQLLLSFGNTDIHDSSGAILLANLCTQPNLNTTSSNLRQNQRRTMKRTTWIWTGAGGCKSCNQEAIDMNFTQPGDGIISDRKRTLQEDSTEQLVIASLTLLIIAHVLPNYVLCLGVEPEVIVRASRIGVSDISKTCPATIYPLLSISNLGKGTSFGFQSTVCESCISLDFSSTGTKAQIVGGSYVKSEWKKSFGVVITASSSQGGYTPKGQARIYDTRPPVVYDRGNVDLGSPNRKCGGNGVGIGGEPGQPGENCVPLNNVLIIQEANTVFPKANRKGGKITFDFDKPVLISDIGFLDVDEAEQTLIFEYQKGKVETFTFRGLGDNSVQRVIANKFRVRKLTVEFTGTAAVTELNYCPVCLL